MSSDIYVKARGLGKKYELFAHPFGHLAGTMWGRPANQHIWALAEFNLDARPGDFIGIVGRNGAGKSTLLELVTGVVNPSAGSVKTGGRIAALLELGAGFNADFTGRENAQLCASIYGLTSKQIAERLPSIEAFAGVGAFIDRPTREYSSGMYARLAFSVSIHVDADILIVDEILGVGDVRFQQRSMKFLREFSRRGIVLFVSHNEAAILSLCNRAIWLSEGQTVKTGSPKEIVQAYHKAMSRVSGGSAGFQELGQLSDQTKQQNSVTLIDTEEPLTVANNACPIFYDFDRVDNSKQSGTIEKVELASSMNKKAVFRGGEDVILSVYGRKLDLPGNFIAFVVRDGFGQVIFSRDTLESAIIENPGKQKSVNKTKNTKAEFKFVMPFLPSGSYAIDVAVIENKNKNLTCLDRQDTAVAFSILSQHISAGLANVAMLETRMLIDGEPAA